MLCRMDEGRGKVDREAGLTTMREFAEAFYNSPAWRETRKAFTKSKGGLCERCYAMGIIKAGEIVHHKIHLSPGNINDPAVTLNWNNLELLCREHHGEEHQKVKRRYKVDAQGRVTGV